MKKHTSLIVASLIALVLSLVIIFRVTALRHDFDRTVKKALRTSAGYDKSFTGMVNRLEIELAHRASFGYQGGKDPMTGRVRHVVPSVPLARSAPATDPAAAGATPDKKAEAAPDPVKLTAIIFDNKNNRFTAIVMDNERSLSMEVGDKVRDRIIRKITDQIIVMESDSMLYQYDIFGKCLSRRK